MPDTITVAQLAEQIGGRVDGDPCREITGVASLESAGVGDLAFLANPRYEKHLSSTAAAAVIVAADVQAEGVTLIRCKDPYFAFREAMVLLHGFRESSFIGSHRRAYVDQRAAIGENVAVGPFAVICEGASIGENTLLYPGVFVGPNTSIGRDCILHPNVVVYENCRIGERVTIHANSTIGQDGFGYATHGGKHHKIPQVGGVVIENDVEIGANCAIDRATIGDTRIGEGTKFSNLIAIGHGTQIGKHNLLVAQAGLAGSVQVGDYVTFAGQVGVVGHITIGDRVRIGAKAGVTGDVESDTELLGAPAVPLAKARRVLIAQSQLPEMRDQLRKLQRQVEKLSAKLEASKQTSHGDEPSNDRS